MSTLSAVTVRFSLPSEFTVLSAELYAIDLAVGLALEENGVDYLVLTDSLSALLTLQNPRRRKAHPFVGRIVENIVKSGKNIVLAWIPSHVGIPGNELVDSAAKEASLLFPVPRVSVPSGDYKTWVKYHIEEQCCANWKNVPISNKLRSITSTPNSDYWPNFTRRRDQVVFTRLRLGHTQLTHGYLLQKRPSPECEFCEVRLTVRHVLIDCAHFAVLRRRFGLPSTLSEILDGPDVNPVLQFLNAAGLYAKI